MREKWQLEDAPEINQSLRFQGQYFDAVNGLHYNLNRYYDPWMGRYLTADPVKLIGGLNPYRYVYGNPVGWVDPMGLKGMPGSDSKPTGDRNPEPKTSPDRGLPPLPTNYSPLDWDAVVPKKGAYVGQVRTDHVRLHNVDNPAKPNHGVFYGDGVDVTNQAWEQAARTGVTPDSTGTLKVKMDKLTGRAGGMAADTGELFYSIYPINLKMHFPTSGSCH